MFLMLGDKHSDWSLPKRAFLSSLGHLPWESMTMRKVPSSLKTTGKVGMVAMGSTVSTSPSESSVALFCMGITRFLHTQTIQYCKSPLILFVYNNMVTVHSLKEGKVIYIFFLKSNIKLLILHFKEIAIMNFDYQLL